MHTLLIAAAIQNPLDGILPDFSFGGQEFTQLWQKLVAAVWAIGIIIAIVYLIRGFVAMAGASNDMNPNPQAHAQGRAKALGAFIALVALAALAVIVGVTLSFAG
jgi:cytochrome b561